MKCLYCNIETDSKHFTKEHVIPKRIGGNIEPNNPFLLDCVCKRCNEIAGLYIDAPFTRNWFIDNSKVSAARKFLDLSKQPVTPLRYMGVMQELNFDNRICEFWMGPTGDLIYHFHLPDGDESELPSMVGRSLKNKAAFDPGFVFLFIKSNNPVWHPTIVFSVLENFEGSIFYLGNGKPPSRHFKEIPSELKGLHARLLGLNGKEHNSSISIPIDFTERFLAKVALGCGALFLNHSFKESMNANLLRQFMWEKDVKKRKLIGVRHTSLYDNKNADDSKFMKELFCWPGAHTVSLFSLGDLLVAYLTFYGDHMLSILLSDNKEHWAGKISERDAMIFIIVPGLRKYVGPVNMISMIAHKHDKEYSHPALANLQSEMDKLTPLPPFMI